MNERASVNPPICPLSGCPYREPSVQERAATAVEREGDVLHVTRWGCILDSTAGLWYANAGHCR
ncbi:MAG: hypothetical protein QOC89_2415, partial [Paraburkholderia sp.]|nr:hypothetical protein [Paraburkholderia sp.]